MLTEQFKPDLMILDYMLPDINGNVVCQTVRSNSVVAAMKIIVVSGVVDQHQIESLLEAGADEFIKKPFNIQTLMEKVGNMLAV